MQQSNLSCRPVEAGPIQKPWACPTHQCRTKEDRSPYVYLKRDVTGLSLSEHTAFTACSLTATETACCFAAGPTWSDDYGPQRRKISLNPSVRLQADKLEMALNYLGIQPTKEQQEVLQQQLPKDSKGTVSFGDFVQVARSLFCLQLDGTGDAHGLTRAVARLLDSQFVLHDPLEMEEVEELRREKNEALKEVHKLKGALCHMVVLLLRAAMGRSQHHR
uniref:Uncharacterized protein n=1 Tax=Sphaerodactylus townsendi TaxID=933632 RepID=A0ACB8EN10_9SAUR